MTRFALFLILLLSPASAQARAAGVPDVHTILDVGRPLGPGDYVWEDDGETTGPARIVVDVTKRRLYVYRGGVEIGRSYIVIGPPEQPTPTGRFPILQKHADHYSSTYDNAPMPYMLRLTWGGVAIHGSPVEEDWVTHGCIGVPTAFARILYANARKGDEVIVTRRWLPNAYD
ncbi:L,D-transpeptidase family protein [Sphingomonas sp. Leaf412]|uniref:L,D-transpeptidase family protein n=1 Tax=Sphingomonas sp. Leaf412 TaxID=1736370 RepID=UPI0009EA0A1B|nr:L,D-transpeptidase family protein [Sphingomonas sp. Leaf412]